MGLDSGKRNFVRAICLLLAWIAFGFTQSQPAAKHFDEAHSAEARGDWTIAEAEYRAALTLAPQWAEVWVNLGVVLNRQEKSDEAIKAFTRAAQLKPGLTAAYLNLAITY